MSGGYWEYVGFGIQEGLNSIGTDEEAQKRWPKTCRICANLADVLYQVEHDMDWNLSGDSAAPDDAIMARLILDAVTANRNGA